MCSEKAGIGRAEMQGQQRAARQGITEGKTRSGHQPEFIFYAMRGQDVAMDNAEGGEKCAGKSPEGSFEEIMIDTEGKNGREDHRGDNEPLGQANDAMNKQIRAE